MNNELNPSMTNDNFDFLKILLNQNNERLLNLETKVDKLSQKFFFYVGFASAVSSLISLFVSKFF